MICSFTKLKMRQNVWHAECQQFQGTWSPDNQGHEKGAGMPLIHIQARLSTPPEPHVAATSAYGDYSHCSIWGHERDLETIPAFNLLCMIA
jgi:hypothetical protein